MSKDSLGDRIKYYESFCTSTKLHHNIPIIIRLDGVSFHTFTKGLNRPFDARLTRCMVETTRFLCKELNAVVGYTQSDEITLILFTESFDSKVYFDAKLYKLISVIASKATVKFNELINKEIPEKASKNPVFDCRIFNVPSKEEAVNCLIWRQMDAKRNAISMAAQSVYSHKELQCKSSSQKIELLNQKQIDFNEYPSSFKEGTFIFKNEIVYNREDFEPLQDKTLYLNNNKLGVDETDKWYLYYRQDDKKIYLGSIVNTGRIFQSSVSCEYFENYQEASEFKTKIENIIKKFKDNPEINSFSRFAWKESFIDLLKLNNRANFIFNNESAIFKNT